MALLLSALLFQRHGNIRSLEWTWIDLDKAMLTIPAESMKRAKAGKLNGRPHLVPLPSQAVAASREILPLTGQGRYVFRSLRTGDKPMSNNTVNAALRGMGYTKDEMTAQGRGDPPPDALYLPKIGATANGLKPAELKMAQQLIEEMTSPWKPDEFKDDFTSAVRALIQKKAAAGEKATVEPFEEAPDKGDSNVIDLSELLRQSLGTKKKDAGAQKPAATTKKLGNQASAKKSGGNVAKTKKAA